MKMILYCENCQKPKDYFPSTIKALKNKLCRKCYFLTQKGENHPNWKGNEVGYKALHDWINRNWGKPYLCECCKTTTAKKFEWANISGKYKREKSDWMRLCTSCHHYFDKLAIKGWITKRSLNASIL